MQSNAIDKFRLLRRRVRSLNENVVEDLRPFIHKVDSQTFRRLPTSASDRNDINVTTTCTAFITLAVTRSFDAFHRPKTNAKELATKAFARTVRHANWRSSKLPLDNVFTTTVVVRAAGILADEALLTRTALKSLKRAAGPNAGDAL